MSRLNALYRSEPALYTQDFSFDGFEWIDCSDNRHSVVSFLRRAKDDPNECIVTVCNFTPQPHSHYRVRRAGVWLLHRAAEQRRPRVWRQPILGNLGGKWAEEWSFHNRPYSIDLCLPPLGVLILKLDRQKTEEALQARQLAAQSVEE